MDAWLVINRAFKGGWPPSELNAMSLPELMQWYHKAAPIVEADNKT